MTTIREIPFALSIDVWGYAVGGPLRASALDMAWEVPAATDAPNGMPLWDDTSAALAHAELRIGGVTYNPPLHWCLPYVSEAVAAGLLPPSAVEVGVPAPPTPTDPTGRAA